MIHRDEDKEKNWYAQFVIQTTTFFQGLTKKLSIAIVFFYFFFDMITEKRWR